MRRLRRFGADFSKSNRKGALREISLPRGAPHVALLDEEDAFEEHDGNQQDRNTDEDVGQAEEAEYVIEHVRTSPLTRYGVPRGTASH